jgi:hypothetical protein
MYTYPHANLYSIFDCQHAAIASKNVRGYPGGCVKSLQLERAIRQGE